MALEVGALYAALELDVSGFERALGGARAAFAMAGAGLEAEAGAMAGRLEDILLEGIGKALGAASVCEMAYDSLRESLRALEAEYAALSDVMRMMSSRAGEAATMTVVLGRHSAAAGNRVAGMASHIASAGAQAEMSRTGLAGFAEALSRLSTGAATGGTSLRALLKDIGVAADIGQEALEKLTGAAGSCAEAFAGMIQPAEIGALTTFAAELAKAADCGRSLASALDSLGAGEAQMERLLPALGEFAARMSEALHLFQAVEWADSVRKAADAALLALAVAADQFIKAVTDLKTAVAAAAQDAQERCARALLSAVGQAIGTAFISGIGKGVTAGSGSLQALMGAVGTGAKSAFDGIFSPQAGSLIGAAMVNGIISGINSRAGGLCATMRALADSALSAARARLGIRSPSAVMRDEVGAMIAEGIGLGITRSMDVALGPMGLLAGALADSMELRQPLRTPGERGEIGTARQAGARGEEPRQMEGMDARRVGMAIADQLLAKGALSADVVIDGTKAGQVLANPVSRKIRTEADRTARGRAARMVLT